MAELETVEIGAAENVDGVVIWLHGLGADGHDFEPIVPELRLSDHVNLRFVFPHAPVREVTVNNGIAMRAWYDIVSLDRDGPQDEDGIRQSSAQLLELVEKEIARGVPQNRIVLAGFSQGGAIALHTALRETQAFAGLMVLSSWLPLADAFVSEVLESEASQPRDLPVFIAHGSYDPILPLALGEASRDTLQKAGFSPQWQEYPMAHAVCAEEILAIRQWLLTVYGAAG